MGKLVFNYPGIVYKIIALVVLLTVFLPSKITAQAIGVTVPAASGSICAGTTLNITFTISGTFSNTPSVNVFSAQISDAIGSFGGSPVTIGTRTALTAGTILCTLPSTLLTSSLYRYRVISNNPAINGSDNGADETVYAISLNSPTVTQTSFCQNETFTVTFTQSSCNFVNTPASNIYSVELSNASGSFTTPAVIGTYTATTPGPVVCTIPVGTSPGTGYRIRMTACSPAATGSDNGSNLSILAAAGTPSVFGNGRWNVYCYGARNSYSTSYMGWYTETSLSFSTTTRWAATASPSSANSASGNAYSGCVIQPANYSYVYKRTNIPCGYYQIDIPGHRTEVYILINGSTAFQHTVCCDAHTGAWTGVIDPTDSIEILSSSSTTGSLIVNFTKLNQISMSAPITICAGTSGTIAATNTGTLPVNYAWTPTASATPSTTALTTVNPVTTTTYVVLATDPVSNCTVFTNSLVVTVASTPTVTTAITTATICNGFTNATITAAGAYTYSWSPATGLSATSGSVVIATPTITTVYTVTGSNNCTTATSPKTVTVKNPPSTPSPTAFGSNVWNVYCYNNTALTDYYGYYTENNLSFDTRNRWGANSSPSVAATTTAGSGYSGCQLIPAQHGTIHKRTGFACGYYRIDITNDDGVSLYINGSLIYSQTSAGTHTGTAGGLWTGFVGASTTIEIRQFNTSAGSSFLTASFVTVPVPILSPPVTICFGSTTTFTAGTITGVTYSWSPGANLNTTTGTITTSSATVSTNYTCVITDALTGCTSASSTSLTINPVPTTSVSPVTSTINCSAETYTLTASGANTYSWLPATGLSATTGYSVIASPTANTIYTVTGSNNCTTAAAASTVIVVPLVNYTVFPSGTWNVYCFNSATLSNYYGYYTEDGSGTSGYDFNTTTRWNTSAAPSTANATNGQAYKGCTMPTTNYFMSYKRTGFTCNTYSLVVLGNDDVVYALINGTQVATRAASSASAVLWTGVLSNVTTVELRLSQTTANASLSVSFVPGSVTSSVSVWSGGVSSDWFNTNNWCASNVPGSADDVIIYNSGTLFQPSIGASGANCLDIVISGSATSIPAASLTVSGAFGLNVYGDWINRGYFNPGTGTVSILGTGPKTMSASTTQTLNKLVINTTGSVTLSPTIHKITSNMDFQNGIVISTGTLQFLNGATATNASDVSYVEGPVVKFGNQGFTFPIGLNSIYRPVSISAPVNTSDNFTAQYFYANPSPPYTSTSKDATIDHISSCEHWILNRTGGSSIVNVVLTWDANSCGISTISDLVVARWDAGQVKWKDHGATNVTGNTTSGSMQSSSPVTVFSPFTLGSKTNLNPLPIELLEFNAVCVPDGVDINWTTASERNNDYFSIERSSNGQSWEEIKRSASTGNSSVKKNYSFTDHYFAGETFYYRLSQVDKNQHKEVLKTAVTQCHLAQNEFKFYPNPARNEINLVFNVSRTDLNGKFTIIDNLGRICHSEHMDLKKGTNIIMVPIKLKPGIYFISYSSELFRAEVRKLVIEQ